jgi:hypothetical protein
MAGTIARSDGAEEKQPRVVASLATWPEERWRELERLVLYKKKNPRPHPALRRAIVQAVAYYIAAPDLTPQLFLHPDDPCPIPAATRRATRRKLAEVAQGARRLGLELVVPRTPRATLVELLVHECLRDDPELVRRRQPDEVSPEGYESASGPSPWHLGPDQLERLALCAQAFAKSDRDPPGPPVDLALAEFVWRLTRIIEKFNTSPRVKAEDSAPTTDRDPPARKRRRPASLWVRESYLGIGHPAEYDGQLFEVVRLLQSALPSAPGSIAECRPSTLAARLDHARDAGRRRWGSGRS